MLCKMIQPLWRCCATFSHLSPSHARTHARTHAHTHTHTHAHTFACQYTHIYTLTHTEKTHTHTHQTQIHNLPPTHSQSFVSHSLILSFALPFAPFLCHYLCCSFAHYLPQSHTHTHTHTHTQTHTHAHTACLFACWLLNVPVICMCVSVTDLLRQFYVLPCWDRSCRANFLPHPVTVYWHQANQSQRWPYNTRRLAG